MDYRQLNVVTIEDAYPLPRIDESSDHVLGSCWFSTLDLSLGYWQVEVDNVDRPKSFGLCYAPETLERLMETVLCGHQWDICLVYLDDIIVFSKTFEEMTENLHKVFVRLRSAGLKLKATKCILFGEQVEYLGHVISKTGVAIDPKNVEAFKHWIEQTSVKEARSFIVL